MGELFYPFATGAGANADENAWLNIFLGMGRPGVLIGEGNEFAVSAPGGAAVKVDTGRATCFGHYYELTAQTANLTVAANGGATRFDRVVIRFDFAGDAATVMVITGTTSAAATLTASRTGTFDLPLAVLAVPNGASITTGAITMALDRWAAPVHGIPAGVPLPFFGAEASIPKNFIVAAGQTVDRFSYERLWNIFPSPATPRIYGKVTGSPSPLNDAIIIPDMRGRMITGLDTMGSGDAGRLSAVDVLGNPIGDNESVVPVHSHLMSAHNWVVGDASSSVGLTATASVPNKAVVDLTPNSTDNSDDPGVPDPNLPPAMLANWMILV